MSKGGFGQAAWSDCISKASLYLFSSPRASTPSAGTGNPRNHSKRREDISLAEFTTYLSVEKVSKSTTNSKLNTKYNSGLIDPTALRMGFRISSYIFQVRTKLDLPVLSVPHELGEGGKVHGDDGEAAAEHVDDLHREVEAGAGGVEADAQVCRGQEPRVVLRLEPRGHHLDASPVLLPDDLLQ